MGESIAETVQQFEGLVNLRDLGGLPTSKGQTTKPGVLFRSESPQLMTPGDVERAIGTLDIQRVVDLRGERGASSGPLGAEGRGVRIDFLTLTGGFNQPEEMTPAGFLVGQLDRAGVAVGQVIEEIVESPGATLIHCHTGKDRTGFVVAIILATAGVGDDEIIADYMRSSPVYDTMVANLTEAGMPIPERAPDFAKRPPSAEGIAAMLAELRRQWPTPDAYLADAGVSPALVERLKAKLLIDGPDM